MLTTNVLPWLRNRRVVALIVAIALVVSLAFSVIGNSWTANAAPEDVTDVVAEDDTILAGPSWTFSRGTQPPVDFFGPSWG
ncbi:MAG: hypothetical protein QNJ81_00285 [Acidimicrobiia bacterium]|nr:hypothetical protein [Acidimicrobiia bacterium]